MLVRIRLYADDSAVSFQPGNSAPLQGMIDKLEEYCEKWGSKSEFK